MLSRRRTSLSDLLLNVSGNPLVEPFPKSLPVRNGESHIPPLTFE